MEKLQKSFKPAFTFAEVLITLAIVGIIASITIPSVISKNEKQQLYVRAIKTYNTLLTALNMAIVQYGDPINWYVYENPDYITTYLLPHLKNTKICKTPSNCFGEKYKLLNGDYTTSMKKTLLENPFTIQLANGASVTKSSGATLIFDTNGPKGPNTFGRDLFKVNLTHRTDDSTVGNLYGKCKGRPFCMRIYRPEIDDNEENPMLSANPNQCVELNAKYPQNCLVKLLIEGKMNY